MSWLAWGIMEMESPLIIGLQLEKFCISVFGVSAGCKNHPIEPESRTSFGSKMSRGHDS